MTTARARGDPAPSGHARPRGRSLAIGAAVLALVLGLAVGFVVGGGTSRDTSAATVETAPDPTPSVEPATPAAPDLSPPCLRAGAAATEVLAQLELAVPAIAALDATALRQIVERLEPLHGELERAVAGCRAESPGPPR